MSTSLSVNLAPLEGTASVSGILPVLENKSDAQRQDHVAIPEASNASETPMPTEAANTTDGNGTAVKQPPNERVLDTAIITDHEKQQNPEWFVGRTARSPERYMELRNIIYAYWLDHKPQYINKTMVRRSFPKCGDVNAFGRIHDYLERAGYINVNCVQATRAAAPKRHRTPAPYKPREPRPPLSPDARKRRDKHKLATWDDPDLSQRQGDSRRKREVRRRFYNYDEVNPYQLIEMEEYTVNNPAPFQVVAKTDALAMVDFHAHLVMTEIMGLLGGTFQVNDHGEKILTVECVYPCNSVSTDIQCEMEGQSKVDALAAFEKKGFKIVGWYHSHPEFQPTPSIQDIETQMSYQTLFRDHGTGDEPFIGIIINPYQATKEPVSWISYVHISNLVDATMTYRIPFICQHRVENNANPDTASMLKGFSDLVERYRDHQEKVDTASRHGAWRKADKMCVSLKQFVPVDADAWQTFVTQVSDLLQSRFSVLYD
ncbi:hypothetical protein BC940DRAFT_297105 [Gongronella butleri]|nr:hypothetical protein BC940DRAFT_297105 [Gongronella butleri]